MVTFHSVFDLNHFGYIQIDIYNLSGFWQKFRNFIVFLFLLIVGVSLYLANFNGINRDKFLKRLIILFFGSMLITTSTYFIFPNSWIYFGIIHFIFLASIIGIWFVKFPNFSLFLSIVMFIGYKFGYLSSSFIFKITLPILNLPYITEDLIPFFMWFWVVLLGIFIGSKKLFKFKIIQNSLTNKISFLGKNSLLIYFIHQPMFFGIFYIISR